MEVTKQSNTPTPAAELYVSRKYWSAGRPAALVIACSDGRLQENIDDFLQNHLSIMNYDRIFMPGGPGALATSGFELSRADQFRRECAFLIEAHGTEEVILIFHGAAADGPPEATCADYCRKMPHCTPAEISDQQKADVAELMRQVFGSPSPLRVQAYRAEVTRDGSVQFVELS